MFFLKSGFLTYSFINFNWLNRLIVLFENMSQNLQKPQKWFKEFPLLATIRELGEKTPRLPFFFASNGSVKRTVSQSSF